MPQWQYREINLNDPRAVDFLNKVGEQGWELIAITTSNVAYLKRQIADSGHLPATPLSVGSRRRKTTPSGD
jgi:hypothetical protein